eukprot:GEMP01012660.1.p1 GENE.GEMP01012660.1~~GEMP01012660.1.p1  ORF type:complete len:353 (+),score=42.95 GEMP01012660.1:22-1059(+)
MTLDLTPEGGALSETTSETSVGQTCIVLDWDDTILPTTWLERNHVLSGIPTRLRPMQQQQLFALAHIAEITIKMCQQLGHVIIVTNSCPGWLEASCAKFMPSLLPIMKDIPIFAKPPTSFTTYKIEVFYAQCTPSFTNVISIGDGMAERTAALRIISSKLRAKSIKLRDLPTIGQLHQEHSLLQKRLAKVVSYDGDLDLQLQFSGKNDEKTLLVHLTKIPDSLNMRKGGPCGPKLTPTVASQRLNNHHFLPVASPLLASVKPPAPGRPRQHHHDNAHFAQLPPRTGIKPPIVLPFGSYLGQGTIAAAVSTTAAAGDCRHCSANLRSSPVTWTCATPAGVRPRSKA